MDLYLELLFITPIPADGFFLSLTGILFQQKSLCRKTRNIHCICQKGGTIASFDALNKYFSISSMPIISSTYWNIVHGTCPEDVLKDEEGLQTVRNIGRNMAWMLKATEAAKAAGIQFPEQETGNKTNFIR